MKEANWWGSSVYAEQNMKVFWNFKYIIQGERIEDGNY
jgi:hypothetical protein